MPIKTDMVSRLEKVTTKKKYRSNYEDHHIVAKNDRRAYRSRKILKCVRIGIDDQINRIKLKTVVHRRIHTSKIYFPLIDNVLQTYYDSAKGNIKLQEKYVKNALFLTKGFLESLNIIAPF